MKASTKAFAFSGSCYLLTLVFYLTARGITSAEWDRLSHSVFYGSTLDIYPTYNWAHYTAVAAFLIGVGITIAGIMLKRSEP